MVVVVDQVEHEFKFTAESQPRPTFGNEHQEAADWLSRLAAKTGQERHIHVPLGHNETSRVMHRVVQARVRAS